jgi:hypothetical protein
MAGPADPASRVKCFVVGCGRSGTTLLSVLLDRHSQLAMTPETAFYEEVAPKIVPFDEATLAGVLAEWPRLPELELDVATVLARCGEGSSPGAVFDLLLRLYADKRGKRYCGEKTPRHWRHLATLLDDFPAAYVLCIVRDGRDAALSLNAMPWWPYDLSAAATVWLNAAEAARTYSARFPDRVLTVRYEDLVSAPRTILATLMEFIGLRFEPRQLDDSIASRVVMPRSLPWKGKALGAIDQSRVGHWRTTASAAEAAWLNDVLAAELALLDYRGG